VTTTIRRGINSSTAVKKPCKAATTANITLEAEQTIDGIACTDGDRVLVKDQTDASENGIYSVDSSSWDREPDWDGTFDVVQGTYVFVAQGSTNNNFWRVTTADPITIGTTSVALISTDPDSLLRSNLADTSTGEGLSLCGVEDAAGNFTASNGEAVLAEIISTYASTANGDGISKLGVEDSAGNFSSSDGEAVLAEIGAILGTTNATEIAQLDVSARTVSGYVSGAVTHIEEGVGAGGEIDVDSILTASSWESVGPTGSGADNIESGLNSIPSGAVAVILKIFIQVSGSTNTDTYSNNLYARKTGESDAISSGTMIARAMLINRSGSSETDSTVTGSVIIPLDSSLRFDLHYTEFGTTPTTDIRANIVGWIE